jgi:hypothetical protein
MAFRWAMGPNNQRLFFKEGQQMSRVVTPTQPGTSNTPKVPHEKIAMRAYEKWCKRGRPHGTDKQDWTEAEKELRAELSRSGGLH